MSTLLTVSVHRIEIPDPEGKESKVSFRAILWNGRLTKHIDSVKFVGEFAHPNFFKNVRSLRASVKEWRERNQEEVQSVIGVDTAAPCWPIDPQMDFGRVFSVTDGLASEERGLILAPVLRDCGPYSADDMWKFPPEPPVARLRGAVYRLVVKGSNLFELVEVLWKRARLPENEARANQVLGIHDESPCWPTGL